MSFFEGLIYGFVSGLSEFLPVSAPAHQQLIKQLFGIQLQNPLQDLFVHLGALFAVLFSSKMYLQLLYREHRTHRSRSRRVQPMYSFDRVLIKRAAFPLLICMFVFRYVLRLQDSLILASVFLIANGVILFLPDRMVQGNKDSRHMSVFDSLLIGTCGSFSAFCGVSRIACTYSVAIARGAAKKHALSWSIVLSVFALVALAFMDVVALFTADLTIWSSFITHVFSGITSFAGGVIGISALRFLIVRPNNTGFSYYCWGVALLSFVLYLTVG